MKFYLSFLLFFIQNYSFGQYQNLILSPTKPQAGKKITISYSGSLVNLDTKLTAILCYDNFDTKHRILTSKLSAGKLVSSFIIPDSVSYFKIKIQSINEYDNNNQKGYGFYVYKNDIIRKGAYFNHGYFSYSNEFEFDGDFDSVEALKLIEKEYALNPDMIQKTEQYYIEAISRIPSRKLEAIDLAIKKYEEILISGKNENLAGTYTYLIADGSYQKNDSLKKIVTKQFPKGTTAINSKIKLIENLAFSNVDSAVNLSEQLKKEFPKLNKSQNNRLDVSLAAIFAQKYDFIKLDSLLYALYLSDKNLNFIPEALGSLNEIAWRMYLNNNELNQAKVIVEKAINIYKKYDTLSVFYGNALDTYARILYSFGDKKNAIKNQQSAVVLRNYQIPDINEKLVQYLVEDNQNEIAKTMAEKFIKENVSNSKIDSLYKIAYFNSKFKASELDAELAKIKGSSNVLYEKKIKQKLVNIKAPDFVLKDLEGNNVNLTDFRGSTIILDFWATWCSPCIASFPAMKKLMAELKAKNTKFLFIDSKEDEKMVDKNFKINQILKLKNVQEFHVLIDENTKNNVSTIYKVDAIPAKYIIDPNGNIRYKSHGFSTEEDLIKEIKTVLNFITK